MMSPFTDTPGASLASLGEKELLQRIRLWLGDAAPPAPAGMGDDCAVFGMQVNTKGLITTDSVVLNRHFLASDPPASVGDKLILRNLSDIAAMGGTPVRAVIAGLLPRSVSLAWLEACLRRIGATAVAYGVEIVGGDLTETSTDLALNMTLFGTAAHPLLRTGAQTGDLIGVTGALGGSRLGRHLDFTPRLAEGRILAQTKGLRACMDISDGLAIDLPAMLTPSCCALLDLDRMPIHPDARVASRTSGQTPLWHALHDGEDHELCFMMAPDTDRSALPPHHLIGTVIARPGGLLLEAATGNPLKDTHGYEHFR